MNGEPKTVSARLSEEVAARRLQFDATQQAAAARLSALAEELRRPPALLQTLRSWLPSGATVDAPRGLYIWGGVGRGKTLLMDWFFASLPTPRAQRWHFYRFMRGVHAELGGIKGRAQPLEKVARVIAARTNVICLDEFFVADIADAMILAGLFTGLFRRGVRLIATSNLAPQELYKDGLQRQRFLPAIALIESHTEVLHLDSGIDYRLRELERAPTYLDAKLPDTPAALEARFAALAGGSTGRPTTFSIEGRALHAVGTGPGMAWFDFGELCEGPRSQNDYIELARRYSTLFIANIPEFTHLHEDAARRFIMLIDELYDRGVKIVVSAAAAPGALYRGERLQMDFRRAASRLVEMQTQLYLAGAHRA
ncbi:MAG TPA: cell division protein ZapE [Steroidobacteraceae bacterium]|nr:cell division protein ZapE [Steroidobacteraceae bacterium]